MYTKFMKNPRKWSAESAVTYQSHFEEGLLSTLPDIVSSMSGSYFDSSLLKKPYGSGRNESEPFISNNRGVIVAKSSYRNMKQELLGQSQIFWDSEFPADRIEMPELDCQISWKRPFEISPNPQMFTEGITRFDINQGQLGDCWLLAAMACLVIHKNLFHQVVPLDQSFKKGDYCGMFRFRFWFFGQWLEVVIDDLLPTSNGELILIKSNDSCEFWSALLEKAYAKLYGSYKSLIGGFTSEAMVDFTAGIVEKTILRKDTKLSRNMRNINDLFFRLLYAFSQQSLMSCSKEGGVEERHQSGLISGHAYSITAICLVNTYDSEEVHLIRIRNPWGNEAEWKGPWSDGSQEWRTIQPQEIERLQLIKRDDGEFWMEFYDFVNEFDKLTICYIGPQCMENIEHMKHNEQTQNMKWQLAMFYGTWKRGVNAGGCRKYNSYWSNPQFEITISEADYGSSEGFATIIVGLMQRSLRFINEDFKAMGYHIYAKPNSSTGYDGDLQEVASSGIYANYRNIAGTHKLQQGSYVIIPSTYDQNVEGQFLIRLFSVIKAEVVMIDQKVNFAPPQKSPKLPYTSEIKIPKSMQTKSNFINDIFNKYADSSRSLDPTQLQTILNKEFNKGTKHKNFYLSLATVQAFFYLMKAKTKKISNITVDNNLEPSIDNEHAKTEKISNFLVDNNLEPSIDNEQAETKKISNITVDNNLEPSIDNEHAKTEKISNFLVYNNLEPSIDNEQAKTEKISNFLVDNNLEPSIDNEQNDYTEKIIQSDFHRIWRNLLQWKDLFLKYDIEEDGRFNTFELRTALNQSGIQINNLIFESIVSLYSTDAEQCSITFDNYVRCCVQLKSIFDQYQILKISTEFQTQQVTLEQFMDHCLRTISA